MNNWKAKIAVYLWHILAVYPFQKTDTDSYKLESDQTLITYSDLILNHPRPAHLSVYRHFVDMCEKMGLADITLYLSFLCSADYILGYSGRMLDDVKLIQNGSGELVDIVPAYTPTSFDGLNISHMFAYDAKTNLGITGVYEDLDLSAISSFPAEAYRFIKENVNDISTEELDVLINDLQNRIAFVKKHCRTGTYSIDWHHREEDEIRFFLRGSFISESDENIANVRTLRKTLEGDTENAANIIKNTIKNEKLMSAIEQISI